MPLCLCGSDPSGDASALPYPDASFDIALQFTLLSSVLDASMRRAIASETMRVPRPGGVLIWYDFLWNPGNRDVRGVRLGGLRALEALLPLRSHYLAMVRKDALPG